MKERPILFSAPMVRAILGGTKSQTRRVVDAKHLWFFDLSAADQLAAWGNRPVPYGVTGDRIWVRETFFDTTPFLFAPLFAGRAKPIAYRADENEFIGCHKWRPSIFMPRSASRITLEIIGIRVERLQDTTRGDAMAEGCPFQNMEKGTDPCQWYAELWDGINGPGSWETNPYVWVIEFKRIMEEK